MKAHFLEGHEPENYWGDVWLLTERDAGTFIAGSRNDLFVLKLKEHSGSGYLWNIDQLRASGFGIVQDKLEEIDEDEDGYGSPVIRSVTAKPRVPLSGQVAIEEKQPWSADAPPRSNFDVDFDLTGPEEAGLSRAERRSRLLDFA